MVTMTPQLLIAIAKAADPRARPSTDIVNGIAQWWFYLEQEGIISVEEQAGFLGQACIETDYFKTFKEYASGAAYENRADLGNTQKGDGKRFAGKGMFQTTGRANYDALSDRLGVDFVSQPTLLLEPEWAVKSAVDYWQMNDLGPLARRKNWKGLSRAVNRGNRNAKVAANHEPDRLRATEKALTLLGSPASKAKPAPVVIKPAKPAFIVDRKVILEVQQILDAKGWHEVGTVDGNMGKRTEGAVLAFRNEHEPPLGLSTEIDAELLDALRIAPERRVSIARATTTAADLKEKGDETLLDADNLKKVAGAGVAFASLGGGDQEGWIDKARNYADGLGALQEPAQMVLSIAQWCAQRWWVFVLLLCAGVVWYGHRIIKKRVEDHRSGKNLEQ